MKASLLQIVLLVLLTLLCSCAAAYDISQAAKAYCEHSRYTYQASSHTCILDADDACDATEFMQGRCDIRFIREIPCRKLGDFVFPEFEKCCEGVPYRSRKSENPYVCQIPADFSMLYVGIIAGGILFLAALIAYILLRRRKLARPKPLLSKPRSRNRN